jgi:hypothetical protein
MTMTNNRDKRPVLFLSVLALALLLTASLAGILSDDGGKPHVFTSLRGEAVDIYGGEGLYRFDNTYKAVGVRSFDWVSLVVVMPLFILGIYRYQRGQFKGQLLLAALFTYLAYIYAIGVMGNAFNSMFLVWTALFSTGLFGLVLTLSGINIAALPKKLAANFPRKSLAVYIIVVGIILLFQYLSEVISAYITGNPPASLDHYTTLELASLELGIMIPLHLAAGVLLWKMRVWGYLIAILLAFTAGMVFIGLSLSLLLFNFSSGQGNIPDILITVAITLVTCGFSLVVFKQVSD